MKFLTFVLLLVTAQAHAEKKVAAKDMSMLGRIDESTMMEPQTVKAAPNAKPIEAKFSMSCKDSTGRDFKQGDSGYEACLSQMKAQHDFKKHDGKPGNAAGANAGFNFKIGD